MAPKEGTPKVRGVARREKDMAVVRRNVLVDATSRKDFIKGVSLLKNEDTTLTTGDFGIPGPLNKVMTYDVFVIWHIQAMNTPVPPTGSANTRNAAHRGPVFLPWHRIMLIWFEIELQRVLNDASFGLPYWDWSLEVNPFGSTLWANTSDALGGTGTPIPGGGFFFDSTDPMSFSVRLSTNMAGVVKQEIPPRGLSRKFGVFEPKFPTVADVLSAFNVIADPLLGFYDFDPFNKFSSGFRNYLEGFIGPGLHNQVHRWVDGDMSPASSPNDPVFFLHHCNVDRIWEAWMKINGHTYVPDALADPAELLGHRIDDPLVAPFSDGVTPDTPGKVLNVSNIYKYDTLPA
jgi:tyrosinase